MAIDKRPRSGTKKGRLHHTEEAYIRGHWGVKTAAEIGKDLGRSEAVVRNFARRDGLSEEPDKVHTDERKAVLDAKDNIRSTQAWKALHLEFPHEELKYFEESLAKLMAQFRDDVLYSEQTQIFQLVKYEILMSRNLKARKKAFEESGRLERRIEELLKPVEGDPSRLDDKGKVQWTVMVADLKENQAAEARSTKEYVQLQQQHEKLLEKLKATRDQRIKQIESSRQSYLGIIKYLMDEDARNREGRELELMRMAGENAYNKLGHAVRFEDGSEDNPILSADTVDFGPLEEDAE